MIQIKTTFFIVCIAVLLLLIVLLVVLAFHFRAKAEQKVRRQKRQMTNNIAHELRTPLASIRGYLETVVSQEDMPAEQKELFIRKAWQQSIRLSDMIRDISLLSKIEQAPQMLEKEHLCARRIFDDAALEFKDKAAAANIRIYNQIGEDISVWGNQVLLNAIFRNLIENSVKYGGSGIIICISAFREDDSTLRFRYYDTGKGLEKKELERIFERFYRVRSLRGESDGSGLGLSIVRNAVAFHGGEIRALEHNPSGLEFVFELKS